MCQEKYNTKNEEKKYKHINYVERTQIERWYNIEHRRKAEIAKLLNKSERTIRREINRGKIVIKDTSEEIQDENNKYYIKDSTGMGWYKDNYSIGNPEHKTGIDMGESESNKVKNIYDMARNVAEWTMEACGTYQRVGRGSHFYYYGSNSPASERGKGTANYPSVYFGFRLALYLYS